MWNFISSPEDNILESYLVFNVQVFTFAVPLAHLCLNQMFRALRVAMEKEKIELHRKERVIILWRGWGLTLPVALKEWSCFSQKIPISNSNGIARIEGNWTRMCRSSGGERGRGYKGYQWGTCCWNRASGFFAFWTGEKKIFERKSHY